MLWCIGKYFKMKQFCSLTFKVHGVTTAHGRFWRRTWLPILSLWAWEQKQHSCFWKLLSRFLSVCRKLTWFYKKIGYEKRNVPKKNKGYLNLAITSHGEVWLGTNAKFSGLDFDFVIFNYLVLIWNTLVKIFSSFCYVACHSLYWNTSIDM